MLHARQIILPAVVLLVGLCGFTNPARAAEVFTAGETCTASTVVWDWDTVWNCVSGALQHGALFFGISTATCNSTNQGLTAYDTTNNVLEFCDGSNWRDVGAVPAGGGTPSSFSFTALTGQSLGVLVASNTDTITGFTGTLVASVTGGGSPQISVNGGAWGTSAAITPSSIIQVRMTTSGSVSTMLTATVTIGTTTADWNVTTRAGSLQVFKTSGAYIGTAIGGLSGADAICQSEAGAKSYAGTYKAIMSDASISAASRSAIRLSARPTARRFLPSIYGAARSAIRQTRHLRLMCGREPMATAALLLAKLAAVGAAAVQPARQDLPH